MTATTHTAWVVTAFFHEQTIVVTDEGREISRTTYPAGRREDGPYFNAREDAEKEAAFWNSSGADFASDFRVERREVPRTPGLVGIYGSGSTGGDWFDEDG